jgi:adenylate kinase
VTDWGGSSLPRRLLLLLGPLGAGKGTQASALSRRLGLAHLASGDLFRQQARSGTDLGRRAKAYMDRGELVPDDLTIALFMDRLTWPDAARGAILDGFPRTVGQARALDAVLAERGERLERVILIDVPEDEIVRRVAGRWVCPVCQTPYHETDEPPRVAGRCDRDGAELVQREDDRPDVVRARLEKQVPPMREVVEHYRAAGIVDRVDGTQPVKAVTGQLLERLATPQPTRRG